MKKGITVLSLFDGMSCGQQALERSGFDVKKYYASEIDKPAIKVTQYNYPQTIQLGSVTGVDVSALDKIDLLIGGSPCQSFSFAGKRKGMATKCEVEILTLEHYLTLRAEGYEFEGQSYLFWEYMRVLKDIQKYNPNVKFLLENIVMTEKWERVLSAAIGIKPVKINSALVSAQSRKRLYWTNIGAGAVDLFGTVGSRIEQPRDKGILLRDILETDVDEKYFLSAKKISYVLDQTRLSKRYTQNASEAEKSLPHLARSQSNGNGDFVEIKCGTIRGRKYREEEPALEVRQDDKTNTITSVQKDNLVIQSAYNNSKIRRLTPRECERLQTVKDDYTACVSDTQRYKMLGNGWTIDVICHIFSYLEF